MKDRPILFSAPMVLALLAGRKTQTRRLAWSTSQSFVGNEPAKPGHKVEYANVGSTPIPMQRKPSLWQKVKPGDRLWVREAWRPGYGTEWYREDLGRVPKPREFDPATTAIEYLADGENELAGKNRPGIHMPRWASRLTLAVTAVRIERLHAITHEDAECEGVRCDMSSWGFRDHFADLWKRLHGPESWDANPEVVALSFTVHQSNIDALREAA